MITKYILRRYLSTNTYTGLNKGAAFPLKRICFSLKYAYLCSVIIVITVKTV